MLSTTKSIYLFQMNVVYLYRTPCLQHKDKDGRPLVGGSICTKQSMYADIYSTVSLMSI